MLKRKLEDGTIAELFLESDQGGVCLTIIHNDSKTNIPKNLMSFMFNPVDAAEFIDGLRKPFAKISANGRTLVFEAPPVYIKEPISIKIEKGKNWIRFPLREHEIRFIRKALESMAASLLSVSTWSGMPEEL
jgi:hypothetical protein